MMAAIAIPTNGQGTLGDDSDVLRAVLTAAQAPELETEVSPTGRGASIYHAIANQGGVPVRDLTAWICMEKKCSKVSRPFRYESEKGNWIRFSSAIRWRGIGVGCMYLFLRDLRCTLVRCGCLMVLVLGAGAGVEPAVVSAAVMSLFTVARVYRKCFFRLTICQGSFSRGSCIISFTGDCINVTSTSLALLSG